MEKLNLRMVANAFSNKQKVVFQDMERGLTKICEIVELRYDEATITDGELLYDVSFNQIQLVVRPLADLINEIEVGGKKFIPMVELAKIIHLDVSTYSLGSFEGLSFGIKCVYNNDGEDSDTHEVLGFNLNEGFGHHYRPSMDMIIVLNQKELWDKLYEWHFDLDALIEKGFGVDVNTLKL